MEEKVTIDPSKNPFPEDEDDPDFANSKNFESDSEKGGSDEESDYDLFIREYEKIKE